MHKMLRVIALLVFGICCGRPAEVDLLIHNGLIYDGSGKAPFKGDIAVRGGKIAGIGDLSKMHATKEIDAHGLAVAPGFIKAIFARASLLKFSAKAHRWVRSMTL
jgi:urease alpha subunit